MTSCAHLYTCLFWFSIGINLRERKAKSVKQSEVYPRENKTKVITINGIT